MSNVPLAKAVFYSDTNLDNALEFMDYLVPSNAFQVDRENLTIEFFTTDIPKSARDKIEDWGGEFEDFW